MTRSLAHRTVDLDTWRTIREMSPTMHAARLFGVASPEQAAAVMVLGHDLGFSLAQSFQFISIVQGKPTLSPRGALALVRNSGLLEDERIVETPDACTVYMKRRGGGEYELTVTKAQMVAAVTGAEKPDSAWQRYTPNMLRWRAVGWVIDYLFPDVAGGLKRADEFGALVDRDGDVVGGGDGGVVDGTYSEVQEVQSE